MKEVRFPSALLVTPIDPDRVGVALLPLLPVSTAAKNESPSRADNFSLPTAQTVDLTYNDNNSWIG